MPQLTSEKLAEIQEEAKSLFGEIMPIEKRVQVIAEYIQKECDKWNGTEQGTTTHTDRT